MKDIKTNDAHQNRRGHVNIEENILSEGATLQRAHHHSRFQERAEGPNNIFD